MIKYAACMLGVVAVADAPAGPPPGDYVCQTWSANREGLAYVDRLTIAPGEEYSLKETGGGGRYRYDLAADALVFANGPLAGHFVGQYVPADRGVPNIHIHDAYRSNRLFDWSCELHRG